MICNLFSFFAVILTLYLFYSSTRFVDYMYELRSTLMSVTLYISVTVEIHIGVYLFSFRN